MTIADLSNRYYNDSYMSGGTAAWSLDRNTSPVKERILHHSAGFYGAAPVNEQQEIAQIDAMAADHYARFGIGPAYNYVAMPSGRSYFVGKVWTHRAHTIGRNPSTGERWNVDGVAVLAMGDYEATQPPAALLDGLRECFAAIGEQPVYKHGTIPTVNAAGVQFSQGTSCPGRYLNAFEVAAPTPAPAPGLLRPMTTVDALRIYMAAAGGNVSPDVDIDPIAASRPGWDAWTVEVQGG